MTTFEMTKQYRPKPTKLAMAITVPLLNLGLYETNVTMNKYPCKILASRIKVPDFISPPFSESAVKSGIGGSVSLSTYQKSMISIAKCISYEPLRLIRPIRVEAVTIIFARLDYNDSN